MYSKACFWTKSKCVRIVKGQFLPGGTFVPLLARVAAGSLIINRCGNNIKPLNISRPTNPLLLIWQQNTKLYGNQQDDPPSLPSPQYVSPPWPPPPPFVPHSGWPWTSLSVSYPFLLQIFTAVKPMISRFCTMKLWALPNLALKHGGGWPGWSIKLRDDSTITIS